MEATPTMSDLHSSNSEGRQTKHRPHIELPDGEVLQPRAEFAHDVLDVSDKTAQRMNFPTTYIGNVAYVARNASLKIVAERVRRRNQPSLGRRRGAR
jgi:hypothetical protein